MKIFRLSAILLGAVVASGAVSACRQGAAPAAGPDVWAVVDDRQISKTDVEKAYRRVAPQAGKPTSSEEELAAKLNLVDELITEEILLRRARALKIEVTDAEVETAYGERKRNLTDDAFQKELKDRSLTIDDMKQALRNELLTDRVIEREVTAKIAVGDQEIKDFYERNKAQFNIPETQYRLAQIIITPVRGPQVRNRLNDDAGTPEEAKRKADSLMERLKAGSSFAQLAMDYSEDPQSAPQGGDLGFISASQLAKVPPQLRDSVMRAEPGNVSLVGGGGVYTLVLLVSKEAAGQRELSTPEVRDGINTTLRDRKQQLLRVAYLTTWRNNSKIANYLARQISEGQIK